MLSAVVDNAAAALFLMDPQGYPVYMNAAACRMTGYRGVHEIRDKPLHYAVHFKKPDGSPYPMEECPIDRANAEIRALQDQHEVFCRKDGSLFPVKYNVAPVERHGERLGVVIEVRDMTLELEREAERARLLHETQAARERLHNLFLQAPAAIGIVEGPEHVWTFANARYEELVQRSADELIGRRVVDVLPEVEEQGFIALLDRVRSTGEPFRADAMPLTLHTRTGPRTIHLNFVYQPVRGQDGSVEGIMAHAVDVTAQVHAQNETKALAAELERRVAERTRELTQTLRDVESFGYTVSHDLRAPLRAVHTLALRALEATPSALDAEARADLEAILASAANMSNLIEGLLVLSGLSRGELHKERVDVSAMARDVVEKLRAAEPARTADVSIEPGLVATADPRLMRSVLENLLGNAWKFTRGRERAAIDVGASESHCFFVRDNGVGFDMRNAQKLFTPFHRLHSSSEEGTGIGLATVKRIIERHGGSVSAQSEPERGTTILFHLPP